jgi:3-hydroxybutyryl-CoA dehydrogenase
MNISIVGIIGQGTMGAGIAQVAAQNNCKVIAFDTNENILQTAKTNLKTTLEKLVEKQKISADQQQNIINNIVYTSDINALAPCQLIIEAIVENLEIKKKVFLQLENIVSDACILATNTSSLSVTSIAAACTKSDRVVGIHFFNPAPLMALVEIVPAIQTSDVVLQKAKNTIDAWGKKTVIAKDTPGFIVNRIARPFYSEAIKIYEEGFANKETIDDAMKTIGGFKMGPFELMDMIGHDVNYVVTETVWASFFYDPRYKPSFSQKRLLEAGWLGKKTNKGFYNYEINAIREEISTDETLKKTIVDRIIVMLINEASEALFLNIASAQDIETAMTKGVNYPKGLLAWANEIGIESCVNQLDELYSTYHDDKYRCSALLRYKTENFVL